MASTLNTAKEMVPLTGYIHDRTADNQRRSVKGFAFEVRGFEFFRVWATPSIEGLGDGGGWYVSHWDSGLKIGGGSGVFGWTPSEAAEKFAVFIRDKGADCVRERLTELGWDCAPIRDTTRTK